MPRTRQQTYGGDTPQPVGAVPGQEYGMGQQQMELQRNMPAPQMQGPQAAGPGQVAPAGQQPPSGQPSIGDLMAIAKQVQSPGLMGRPTMRAGEPVTHGLPSGPGAGPEVLGTAPQSATGSWMRYLSQVNGDPYFEQLADRLGI